MKILNLYSGIGGNRKLWPEGNEITAIENNPKIAKIYQDFFPNDIIIVDDAHDYLLKHFKEFDFIWSSPPCPSHSNLRKTLSCSVNGGANPIYPDMKLYEEVLFLQGYFKGKYVVENVVGWYKPLIQPQELQRHYFWTNFYINQTNIETDSINIGGRGEEHEEQVERLQTKFGFNLDKFSGIDKRTILRNCVQPDLSLHIFNCAFGRLKQGEIL